MEEKYKIKGEISQTIFERGFLRASVDPVYYETQVLGMILTSAYSEIETCPNRECLTASGKLAREDLVACPRWMALGEKVEIDGKVYECADRLHKRYDNRIDFWMGYGEEGYLKAVDYGLQWKQVLLVN